MNVDSDKYSVAIDLSGPCSSFSLRKGKELIEAKSLLLGNKNNFSFFEIFFTDLKMRSIDFGEITQWYVGNGPGSFTGLRVAASFVSGIIFGKMDVSVRVIPSAFPLAAMVNSSPGDKIAVLYYASKGETLVYSVENTNGLLTNNKPSKLFQADDLMLALDEFDHVTFLNNKFINDVLPSSLNCKTKIFDLYPVELLFADKYLLPDYSLGDLIYVR